MFNFLKNLKFAIAIGNVFKEVKSFIADNKDKKDEILKGVDYIIKGLELIKKQIPVVSELIRLILDSVAKVFKKDKEEK